MLVNGSSARHKCVSDSMLSVSSTNCIRSSLNDLRENFSVRSLQSSFSPLLLHRFSFITTRVSSVSQNIVATAEQELTVRIKNTPAAIQ